MGNALILGISSDIGHEIADHWLSRGFQVSGTFRSQTDITRRLHRKGIKLFQLDFLSPKSIDDFIKNYRLSKSSWDYLIVCPGTMLPIGPFKTIDFNIWKESLTVNLVAPLEIVQQLLPFGSLIKKKPLIVFISGGGTNGAPHNFSSYVIGKIALLKATEILDAELNDFRTVIFGPGWIKTKIHEEVLLSKESAPKAFKETKRRLLNDDFTPIESVTSFIDWAVEQSKEVLAGRNFSSRDDPWGYEPFTSQLLKDPSLLKLRRNTKSADSYKENETETK
ncbi:SDR family NAD(P)-dependent oxidoreductase [bacterium]|nr:SDR family NAD(P)-dependent oxidoreductase [bacterium]